MWTSVLAVSAILLLHASASPVVLTPGSVTVTPVANVQTDPSPLAPFPSTNQIRPVAVDCTTLTKLQSRINCASMSLTDGTTPSVTTNVHFNAGDYITFDLGAKHTLTEVQTNMYCYQNCLCPCLNNGCTSGNDFNPGHQLDAVKLFTSNDNLTWDLWFSAEKLHDESKPPLQSPCDIVQLNPIPTRARYLRFLVPELAGYYGDAVIQQLGIFAKWSTFGVARVTVSSATSVGEYPLVKPSYASLLPNNKGFGPSFSAAQECDATMDQDECYCREFYMRCPNGWSRSGDGSLCHSADSSQSCDLGWCENNPNVGVGVDKCPKAATDLAGFQCSGLIEVSSTMPCAGLIDGTPSASQYVCFESGGHVQLRLNERTTLSRVHLQNFCPGNADPLHDMNRIQLETSDDGWAWTVQAETVNLLEAGIAENCKTIDLRLFSPKPAQYIRISAWAHADNKVGDSAFFCLHSIDAFGGPALPPTMAQIDGGSLEWTPQDFLTGLPTLNRLGGARPLSPSNFSCLDVKSGSCDVLFDGIPSDAAQFDALREFRPTANGGSDGLRNSMCFSEGGSVAQHFDEAVLLTGVAYEAYCNNENHHFGEFNISVSSDETASLWTQVLAVDFADNQTTHDMLACDSFQFTLDEPVLAKSVKLTVRSAFESTEETGHVANPGGFDHACVHEIAFYGQPRPTAADIQASTQFLTTDEKKLFVAQACRLDASAQTLTRWCQFRR